MSARQRRGKGSLGRGNGVPRSVAGHSGIRLVLCFLEQGRVAYRRRGTSVGQGSAMDFSLWVIEFSLSI